VRLLEATVEDHKWIGAVTELWSSTQRWSLRGRTPSPFLLEKLLQEDVALQRVAWADDDRPVALLQLVDVDLDNGFGHLALLGNPKRPDEVRAALMAFLTVGFQQPQLRKVCLMAHADELDVEAFLGDVARKVGSLAGHERRGPDDYVDLLLYEIWKEALPG